jgi:cytochrome o ubiquinol oxidase subunit I
MPRNTGAGVIIAGFSLVFGFAMIWDIWWLAIVCFLGMIDLDRAKLRRRC